MLCRLLLVAVPFISARALPQAIGNSVNNSASNLINSDNGVLTTNVGNSLNSKLPPSASAAAISSGNAITGISAGHNNTITNNIGNTHFSATNGTNGTSTTIMSGGGGVMNSTNILSDMHVGDRSSLTNFIASNVTNEYNQIHPAVMNATIHEHILNDVRNNITNITNVITNVYNIIAGDALPIMSTLTSTATTTVVSIETVLTTMLSASELVPVPTFPILPSVSTSSSTPLPTSTMTIVSTTQATPLPTTSESSTFLTKIPVPSPSVTTTTVTTVSTVSDSLPSPPLSYVKQPPSASASAISDSDSSTENPSNDRTMLAQLIAALSRLSGRVQTVTIAFTGSENNGPESVKVSATSTSSYVEVSSGSSITWVWSLVVSVVVVLLCNAL